ncbi:hypothetical protein EXIGLDRAFT_830132 [Exidia glandulosa HHB12029]|uniref:F-box domain-containing protein n=1 Tax=Exidia glandulosa HHB12029 TaxID=1314781 RepID=A0A165NZ86_EXIGL|nr:hypothetical protein EXIGLDRAFT_830132 [Exidia glandulosa HHB12029]
MPAHDPGANLPASSADTVVILDRLAVQQQKIDTATRLLAAAKLKLREADGGLAAAEKRMQAAEDAFDSAMYEYRRVQWAHSKVEAGVFAAQAQMDEAVHKASIIRAPFHPIRRTPPEVLGLIFELCVSPTHDELPFWRDEQPFMLAHVCNLWRRAALMHPRVWSYIYLDFHRMARTGYTVRYEYLTNVLARSGNAPLRLYCTWRGMERSIPEADALFVPALLSHLRRCESLTLRGDGVGGDNVLPILTAQLPASCTVHLTVPPIEPWDGHVRFPMLVDVRISGCCPTAILRLLEAAPAVQTLLWEKEDDEYFPWDYAEKQPTPLIYPALKSLTLCDRFPSEVNGLVRDIHFTALDTLALQGDTEVEHRHDTYIDTITRTTTSLTYIHLTFCTLSTHNLDRLCTSFARCSRLQRIELDACFSQTALEYFCDLFGRPSNDGSWVCPSLTVIDITRCSLENCADHDGHGEWVRSRNEESVAPDGTDAPNSSGLRGRIAALHVPPSDWYCAELRTEILSLLLSLQ